MQEEFNRQKQENAKCFYARDYMGVWKTMQKIRPTSNGQALRTCKEAKEKIKSGSHSKARSVLYDYLAELEVMGLGISPGKTISVITELKPPVKWANNKLQTDTNCKRFKARKFRKMQKLNRKMKHETALGTIGGCGKQLPMKAAIDNTGTVFLANGWSIGGRTRHVEVKTNFLREMKETGMFEFQWISTTTNEADMFTKNLGGPEVNKFCERVCGTDDYYKNKKEKKTPACECGRVLQGN